jgi:hypothetical protein
MGINNCKIVILSVSEGAQRDTGDGLTVPLGGTLGTVISGGTLGTVLTVPLGHQSKMDGPLRYKGDGSQWVKNVQKRTVPAGQKLRTKRTVPKTRS